MSVTYVEQVPYGYSKNSYPAKSNQPTHRIVSRAPVYDAYSTSYVEHDVGQDQDRKGNLIVILDPGEEVVVHNHYLGHNAEWREITVVGRTYEAKNLFIHSSFIESIARENLPPVTYVNRIESRDYSLSNLIWHTRQKDASYYDSSYAKYFVKVDLQYEIHTEDSLNKNLEKALVRGTRLILEQNAKQVPNDLDVEWCLQYDHFFEVFDFTLEMRSEEYKRLIALVGIDQKYFLPLPQNLAQLPREYSQPSEFEYLTDFYERYPEKRTSPAPDVASNYRRLDLFLDQNNGILNLDRVTENMCAIDPRWCEYKNLDFEVRGNKIEFNWSKPIFASQVSIEESRIYQNQIEKTINYQSQKLVDDFFSDNEYADKASGFLESTRSALANFNSGTNDLFNAIESLTFALDNAPPIDETTAGALSALSNPSTAADLFQPQAVVDESLQDIVDFYNQNTTYTPLVSIVADEADTNEQSILESRYSFPNKPFFKEYYLKEFTNLRYIRVLPFKNYEDFSRAKINLENIFKGTSKAQKLDKIYKDNNIKEKDKYGIETDKIKRSKSKINSLKNLKKEYEGTVYNFEPEEDYRYLEDLFKLIETETMAVGKYPSDPFTVEFHYNSSYELIFCYIKFSNKDFVFFANILSGVISEYPGLQQKRTSYYILELLDILDKGQPLDIKLWTDEFTRFPNVEYVPRFKNIARKEKQLRRGKRNQFVINNVLKKEEDESLNDLGKLVSGSLAAQEYVANSVDTAIQVTDDLINDINTIDDAFDKYLDKQAVDNPILIATLRCLIPQVDLALLPETDEVEIIREAIQTVELALETYDSLNKGVAMSLMRLGIPTSGDSSGDAYQKAFEALGEKAMNLAYAIAVKKALQIVQALCLQAQKFILDLLLALLNGSDEERPDMNKILRTGDQAFPQPGPGQSSQIGAFQRASTGGSIDSSPDPEELQKFFNDVANILSPIEFCAMFSRQTTPSYILDIAFNFLTTKYENTLLPHIRNRGELAAVIKSLSDFIDRDMCDQLVAQYQIPTEGYSHTRILCEDTNRLRNDLLAESFGIELSEIESIVANQNQSNMSLLRDTMNSLQQPSEQVVDIYAQVRNTPEAKEYFQDSPSPDIENLILQDMIKMQEFLNDTKRLRVRSVDAAGQKGLLVGHYDNYYFQYQNPNEPWDPFDSKQKFWFLPFFGLRAANLDYLSVSDLGEIEKRDYIQTCFSNYSPTNLLIESKQIIDPDVMLDSSLYMDEGLFQYLNTSTSEPIRNVPISPLHEDFEEQNPLDDITYTDISTGQKQEVYLYNTQPPEEEKSWFEWVVAGIFVVTAVVITVITGGAGAGVFAAIGFGAFWGFAAAVAAAGAYGLFLASNQLLNYIANLFKANDDMPPLNNIASKNFLERDLTKNHNIESRNYLDGGLTYTDADEDGTINYADLNESDWGHKNIIDRNIFYETNYIENDKRYIFPSYQEMEGDISGFSFRFDTSSDEHEQKILDTHNQETSAKIKGVTSKTEQLTEDATSEEEIEENLAKIYPYFSVKLRNIGDEKYYENSSHEIFKNYLSRLNGKASSIHLDSENNLYFEETQLFPVFSSNSTISDYNFKKSSINIGSLNFDNLKELQDIIYENISQNKESYLHPTVLSEINEGDNEEQIMGIIKKEVDLAISSRMMTQLSECLNKGNIKDILLDKNLENKYSIIMKNSSALFGIESLSSRYYDLVSKFSSGYEQIDQGFTESMSVEDRVDKYFTTIYFIKTFVVEYLIKILPLYSSENFSSKHKNISTEIIYKQIYKYLEFEENLLFKRQFLYYVNAYYYFLNQEQCVEPNMQDASYALKKTIEEQLESSLKFLENQEDLKVNSLKNTNKSILVPEYDIPNFLNAFQPSTLPDFENYNLPEELVSIASTFRDLVGGDNELSYTHFDFFSYFGIDTITEDNKPEPNATPSNKKSYYNKADLNIHEVLSGNGVLWNRVMFRVTYESGNSEDLTYTQIKEIVKPYSKYKIDNIRVPANLDLSYMRVPFVSNRNIGKWNNTKIKLHESKTKYYFDDIEFIYNENFQKFLSIDNIVPILTPCISWPSRANPVDTRPELYQNLVSHSQDNVLELSNYSNNKHELVNYLRNSYDYKHETLDTYRSVIAKPWLISADIITLFDTGKTSIFDLSKILSMPQLSIMLEPIYEKSAVFGLSKSDAEKEIENIISEDKISEAVSKLIETSSTSEGFYKKLNDLLEVDQTSIYIPIIHDFMEKYVYHLDMFNFYSARNYIKRSILDFPVDDVSSEEATELEPKFEEIIRHIQTAALSLPEQWNGTEIHEEMSFSSDNVTTAISTFDIESATNINRRNLEDGQRGISEDLLKILSSRPREAITPLCAPVVFSTRIKDSPVGTFSKYTVGEADFKFIADNAFYLNEDGKNIHFEIENSDNSLDVYFNNRKSIELFNDLGIDSGKTSKATIENVPKYKVNTLNLRWVYNTNNLFEWSRLYYGVNFYDINKAKYSKLQSISPFKEMQPVFEQRELYNESFDKVRNFLMDFVSKDDSSPRYAYGIDLSFYNTSEHSRDAVTLSQYMHGIRDDLPNLVTSVLDAREEAQPTMKDGFISELGLRILGAKKDIHFDGFEEDHEDED